MAPKAPNELYSVLEALKPALKSIDIRTVAVALPEEDWQNLVTSVFITEKTVNEVKKEQRKIPQVRNNNFAIFLDACPFDYTIFGMIAEGEVKFPSLYGINEVQFRKFDPLKLKVCDRQARIDGSLRWIWTTADSGQANEREKLWAVANDQYAEAKRQGYENIFKLITDSLRIDYSNADRKDFELVIPSLGSIESAYFVNSKFEVKINKAPGLTDLQLNLTLEREDQWRFSNEVWRDRREVKEGKSRSSGAFFVAVEVFELDDLLPYDTMNVELIHRKSALTMDRTWVKAPLENVAEPFLKTLEAFCPLDEFKKMLLEPVKYGKEPDYIFENAVTWLLSAAGFHTIHLGVEIKTPEGKQKRFDALIEKTGYNVGPADILAYEENRRLLLIDCDVGPIDEKKIKRLLETVKHFKTSLAKYPQLEIIPVLFCPKDCPQVQEVPDVRIADKNVIERMFEDLTRGTLKSARSRIW